MVHIKSVGDYAWREDLYDHVGEQLGERATSGVIKLSDMTEELAEILLTQKVRLEYRIDDKPKFWRK